jgi:hypothetical protein
MSFLTDTQQIIIWITDIDITLLFHLKMEFDLFFTPCSSVLLLIFSVVLREDKRCCGGPWMSVKRKITAVVNYV